MSDKNNFENEYDSLKDVVEFQNNMFNPGHYIGTGRVMPTISAPGNSTPMVVFCFVGAIAFAAIAIYLLLALTIIGGGIIMLALSALFWGFGFAYLKKAKRYYKEKRKLDAEEIDQSENDGLWQRTCPSCGAQHDIDYPKCPNCKFNYLE